jgi:hypothetical protein
MEEEEEEEGEEEEEEEEEEYVGTRWRIWLRHCATSRKVAGSIPDGIIFH